MAQPPSPARKEPASINATPPRTLDHSPREQGPAAFPPTDRWMRATQVATIGLFVIALLWSAHVSQPVLVPVLLAWVIATVLLPIVQFMQERNVPRVLTAILLAAALLAILLSVLLPLGAAAASWLGRATELRLILQEKLQSMSQPFASLDEVRKTLSAMTGSEPGALKVEQPPANVVTTAFGVLMPAAGQFVLFFGALLF